MEENELVNKEAPEFSLLVVKASGTIIRIAVPFPVKVISDIDVYKTGALLMVGLVKVSEQERLLYVIGNIAYQYHHFVIVLNPIWNQIN